MSWTRTVKEALKETIGNGHCDTVTLSVEDNGVVIGEANGYEQALDRFVEILDARVVDYFWGSKDGKETADILVHQDDVDINTDDGEVKVCRLYRYDGSIAELIEPNTVKRALERAFSGGNHKKVYLKSYSLTESIATADNLEDALASFSEFLDVKVVGLAESIDITSIYINREDVIRVDGEIITHQYHRKRKETKMGWTGTVKEALKVIFKENCGNAVEVCSEYRGDIIGKANSYEQALNLFDEFLDARVVNFYWDGGIASRTACIVINQEDIEKVRTAVDGQEIFRLRRKPGSIQNIKPGCVAENAKYIDVQELKDLLEHKDDVVSALEQKILLSKNDITDCIKILKVLNPERADSAVNSLKLLTMTLERICEYKNC